MHIKNYIKSSNFMKVKYKLKFKYLKKIKITLIPLAIRTPWLSGILNFSNLTTFSGPWLSGF